MSPTSDGRDPVVWVLNLDAEHELEARGRYQPTDTLRRIVRRESRRLIGNLVAPGDLVLEPGEPVPEEARGLRGLAWSPTSSAISRLEAAGARPLPQSAPDVLRLVNARLFASTLRSSLLEAATEAPSFRKHLATSVEEALERLADTAREAPLGWIVRRSFGAAGRGRRRIGPRPVSPADLSWLRASLRLGPLVLEPFVRVTREFTRSGWVRTDGSVLVSEPCYQRTTDAGAWIETEAAGAGGVSAEEDRRLGEAVAAAGTALAAVGYRGPFGIDAFRHEDPTGGRRPRLNPLSEINARFTMDWAVAMPARPERGGS